MMNWKKWFQNQEVAKKEKWGDLYCDGTGFPKDSKLNGDLPASKWELFKLKIKIGWNNQKSKK